MKNIIYLRRYILSAFLIMVVGAAFGGFGCFGDKEKGGAPITSGLTLPIISEITPPDRSTISKSEKIVITFGTSIDTTTLVLDGTMASESDGGSWSTVTYENDTLTISPETAWTIDTGTLAVTCKDKDGNTISTSGTGSESVPSALTYGVQVVYVKSGQSGDGTMDSPKSDIKAAVEKAADKLSDATWASSAQIHVAKGTYEVTSGSNHVVMSEGVSIYGGYSFEDWTTRNPSTNTTIIKDMSSSGGTEEEDPNRAVEAGSTITAATVIDGVKIMGGGGEVSSCIFNHEGSALTILNNTIEGGNAELSLGIYNYNGSSPTISGNSIKGSGAAIENATGILNYGNSSPKIYNNIISGGSGNETVAIRNLFNCSAKIYNNTIDIGSGTNSFGIMNAGSAPAIANNIISAPLVNAGWGIFEGVEPSDPSEVNNNDVFNCSKALYVDLDLFMFFNNICGGNFGDATCTKTLNTPTGTGNAKDDPKFVNQTAGDFHLSNTSPSSVTQGGLDGSALGWGFTTDKDGKTRTAPWSIGAYEYD